MKPIQAACFIFCSPILLNQFYGLEIILVEEININRIQHNHKSTSIFEQSLTLLDSLCEPEKKKLHKKLMMM
ncbi:hypothetical protein QR98_0082260 [Sarcoptes scabiei]|uniref:Uncharacterized protein n=1 Tax=Sarcoptes scabiei TaxID=52283 RepID=A0A132AFG2_SARSC|nr:hypothetical protein QR98_0082260 [Sarcoptes scabiei]